MNRLYNPLYNFKYRILFIIFLCMLYSFAAFAGLARDTHENVSAGTTNFVLDFAGPSPGYQDGDTFEVWVNNVLNESAGITFNTATTVTLTGYTVLEGDTIEFRRITPKETIYTTFQGTRSIRTSTLNRNFLQVLEIAQEYDDQADSFIKTNSGSTADLDSTRLINATDPVDDQDVATKAWVTNSFLATEGVNLLPTETLPGVVTKATDAEVAAQTSQDGDFLDLDQIKDLSTALIEENIEENISSYLIRTFNSVQSMVSDTNLTLGSIVRTTAYYSTIAGGAALYEIVASGTGVADTGLDGGRYISLTGSGLEAKLICFSVVNVKNWGAIADNSTDNQTYLDNAFAFARLNKMSIYFPGNVDSIATYRHSGTLFFGASDMVVRGENTGVRLYYTGTGTQLAINESVSDPQIERCELSNIYLYTETGAVSFDWTGGNYGHYHDFEIQNKTASAVLLYGQGSNGKGPYYNVFSDFSLFGSGYTQIGIQMSPDNPALSANGCNGNIFTNLKRGAVLDVLVDIEAGHGNLFSNISGELLNTSLIRLNNNAYQEATGTLTSATGVVLNDTSKTWTSQEFANKALILTSGTYSGTSRRIATNGATSLTVDKPFPSDLAGTETYEIVDSGAFSNKFINIRQEGDATKNPDCVQIFPGALFNEFSQMEIGSLGSGKLINDSYGHPSNKFNDGKYITQTFTVIDPGAAYNQDCIPRSSTVGGIRVGNNMRLDMLDVETVGHAAGTATVTVDIGGSATGSGTESVQVIATSTNKTCYVAAPDKVLYDSSNKAIFMNVTTDGSFTVGADIIITLTYVTK